jgi:MarR family transcriptional regulator, organic hydroperoxide resistance regulator
LQRDRRLVRLVLADRGWRLEKVIGHETDQLSERALTSLDPAERAALVRSLDRVRRNLADDPGGR